jgi:hypothetical protein
VAFSFAAFSFGCRNRRRQRDLGVGFRGTAPAEIVERLAGAFHGRLEEALQFLLLRGRDLAGILQRARAGGLPQHEQHAVIPELPVRLGLPDLQDADGAAAQEDAGKSGEVVDHHGVEGIAVRRQGLGDETPVVGIGEAAAELPRQGEDGKGRIELEFCPRAPGVFDHDLDRPALVAGRQFEISGHD